MKISELVKRTGVPKETIHFYIREGLLRKPRKPGANIADYTENHAVQLQIIKDLRDNYFLPIPVIREIIKQIKKHPATGQTISNLHSLHFRPVDRLLITEIEGEEAFCKATGLGRKWLAKAREWGVITPATHGGQCIFSIDDVAIGKLMVDMDGLGFGPKDGTDPEDLKHIADFVREYVGTTFRKYFHADPEKVTTSDFHERGSQFHEVISLFFYHLYRKFAAHELEHMQASLENWKKPQRSKKASEG
jgi:DNA-binding transcriptional MerR regulator